LFEPGLYNVFQLVGFPLGLFLFPSPAESQLEAYDEKEEAEKDNNAEKGNKLGTKGYQPLYSS
jgi:hypothetical protein